MALVLSRCKFQATYKPATNDFVVHDGFAGASGLWQALSNAGVGLPATGVKLSFSVQYADRSSSQTAEKRDAFEVADYEILPNGRLKMVGSPESSSAGTAAIEWSGGERELVFLSTIHASVINDVANSVRILRKGELLSVGDYSVTNSSMERISDDFLVENATPGSILYAKLSGDYRVKSLISGVNDIRGRLIVQANINGTWTQVNATNKFLGHINIADAGTAIVYHSPSFALSLAASQTNNNGHWQFRVAAERDFANTAVESYETICFYEEVLT